ncbi:EPIDERMAL PATTERNING FACTOR-like protein 2 isoform X1 [Syzygium oleosum]|uniref:EPIDERMAL PATTERNING FACTOR-like protein 2 isoform X1 n=2 Tax=Syzygium oleosum TaxID=219896 RepID=UPI0011D212D1|nr:EPIDERMAL PATTERNING FACTOR-like protein 2 isoform X1 [Syzygium oleosum]XP_056173106.1 EPIDERMAL PATTERNING FACTOR-like protein 2 isoform X1 [Syzygium oleosum]
MGSIQEWLFFPRSGQTMVFLLLLFLWGSTQVSYVAEGRVISSKLTRGGEDEQEKVMLMKRMRSLIGSRPPMCARKCSSCGHCEAVQVPFVPQQVRGPRRGRSAHSHIASASTRATTAYYSRGDDISNYKPMTWKCKCGDMFFNP